MYCNSSSYETSIRTTECVTLLLARGVDVNMVVGHYGTALKAAPYHHRLKSMTLLLSRGADVNAVSGKFGTALRAAKYHVTSPQAHVSQDVIELLLHYGASTELAELHVNNHI
jgi:hypothetical protein